MWESQLGGGGRRVGEDVVKEDKKKVAMQKLARKVSSPKNALSHPSCLCGSRG